MEKRWQPWASTPTSIYNVSFLSCVYGRSTDSEIFSFNCRGESEAMQKSEYPGDVHLRNRATGTELCFFKGRGQFVNGIFHVLCGYRVVSVAYLSFVLI